MKLDLNWSELHLAGFGIVTCTKIKLGHMERKTVEVLYSVIGPPSPKSQKHDFIVRFRDGSHLHGSTRSGRQAG